MKSEKGVTLISLMIYVIAMLITVTIITVITSYFTKNVDITSEKYTYFSEFTKLETHFAEEANREKNKILEVSEAITDSNNLTQQYISLSSGNQYTFVKTNNAIYENNVKIASGVDFCKFSEIMKNGKSAIKLEVTIQDKSRTIEYVLKN